MLLSRSMVRNIRSSWLPTQPVLLFKVTPVKAIFFHGGFSGTWFPENTPLDLAWYIILLVLSIMVAGCRSYFYCTHYTQDANESRCCASQAWAQHRYRKKKTGHYSTCHKAKFFSLAATFATMQRVEIPEQPGAVLARSKNGQLPTGKRQQQMFKELCGQ